MSEIENLRAEVAALRQEVALLRTRVSQYVPPPVYGPIPTHDWRFSPPVTC